MSRFKKLLEKFLEKPSRKDLTFEELATLLQRCGYEKIEGSGSRVKFFNQEKSSLISLHKPHPTNIIKTYILKEIEIKLKECRENG